MISDMLNNRNIYPTVTELFIRGSNHILFLITQSYFTVRKSIRINSAHYFTMKIPLKRELQQIKINHSFYIDFKDFMKR